MKFATFLIINAFILTIFGILWLNGFWSLMPILPSYELWMLKALFAYFLVGWVAVIPKPTLAIHVANGLPMLGLGCTGLAIVLAFATMTGINQAALLSLLKEIAYAIPLNITGVMLMFWLRELIFFSQRRGI